MEERIRFDEYGRVIEPEKENSKGDDRPSRERMDPYEYEMEQRRREELAYRKRTAKWINPALYGAIACVCGMAIVFIFSMVNGGRSALFGIPMALVFLFGLASGVLAVTSLALIRSAGVRAHVQNKYALIVILVVVVLFVFVGLVIAGIMG